MTFKRKYFRSVEDARNSPLILNMFGKKYNVNSFRYSAMVEIYRRLPEEVIFHVMDIDMIWIVPPIDQLINLHKLGYAMEDDVRKTRVIYLSDRMEEITYGSAMGLCVLVIANLYLGHKKIKNIHESLTKDCALNWGFEKEIEELEYFNRKKPQDFLISPY